MLIINLCYHLYSITTFVSFQTMANIDGTQHIFRALLLSNKTNYHIVVYAFQQKLTIVLYQSLLLGGLEGSYQGFVIICYFVVVKQYTECDRRLFRISYSLDIFQELLNFFVHAIILFLEIFFGRRNIICVAFLDPRAFLHLRCWWFWFFLFFGAFRLFLCCWGILGYRFWFFFRLFFFLLLFRWFSLRFWFRLLLFWFWFGLWFLHYWWRFNYYWIVFLFNFALGRRPNPLFEDR
mmetsp:Transcript_7105/g.17333  ORF Transcript_7105/g.17333 Transcript_7105/m.17333 type:complete len:236 (+) Transcript_7105:2115-2822(+)